MSSDPAGRDHALLVHMLDCLDRIADYSGGSKELFMQSRLVQDGVARNLHMLTESSQRLSAAAKAVEPTVPWPELAGFRNVLVHGYLGIDLGAVWSVVEDDLPSLKAALQRLLAGIPPNG